MPDIVYLVEHPDVRGFSTNISGERRFWLTDPLVISETLIEDGFQIDKKSITHVLIDHRFPLSEFPSESPSDLYYWARLNWVSGFEDLYGNRPGAFRHKTNIHALLHDEHRIFGDHLGYRRYERKEKLNKMVRAYVAAERYHFAPPFFSITDPESFAEVKEAFEQLGLEVKLVGKSATHV